MVFSPTEIAKEDPALCRKLLSRPVTELLPGADGCRLLLEALTLRPPLRYPNCSMIRLGFRLFTSGRHVHQIPRDTEILLVNRPWERHSRAPQPRCVSRPDLASLSASNTTPLQRRTVHATGNGTLGGSHAVRFVNPVVPSRGAPQPARKYNAHNRTEQLGRRTPNTPDKLRGTLHNAFARRSHLPALG